MAIDKSVFDLRRKVPFVQQEKMHAHDLVVHGPQCFLHSSMLLKWAYGREFWKSCLTLREVQNYLAGEEFEHLRNKLESDRICNRGFWEKNVRQENKFFRVLDLLIYLGKV